MSIRSVRWLIIGASLALAADFADAAEAATTKILFMGVNPDQPVCRGWKEWEIDDEYYLDPTIVDAKPLLRVTERGGKDVIVGWVFDRPGGGRSFATTLGHPYKNFRNESFRRMVVNGILWSAGIDVPMEGAGVDVPADALALPPEQK